MPRLLVPRLLVPRLLVPRSGQCRLVDCVVGSSAPRSALCAPPLPRAAIIPMHPGFRQNSRASPAIAIRAHPYPGLSKVTLHPLMVSLSNHKPHQRASFDKLRMSQIQ